MLQKLEKRKQFSGNVGLRRGGAKNELKKTWGKDGKKQQVRDGAHQGEGGLEAVQKKEKSAKNGGTGRRVVESQE